MNSLITHLLTWAGRHFGRLSWRTLIVGVLADPLAVALPAASAQAATYTSMATTSNWVNPAAHTRAVWSNGAACSSGYAGAPVDDDITAQLPLGFTFNFGGVNYTQVQIMSNGRLQFNNGYCGYGTQTTGSPPTYTYPYPTASVSRTMRIYGVDLDATPSGTSGVCPTATCYVSYATEGTAPNRRFVVTWVNVPEWSSTTRTGSFNLQVILEETTNEFVYQFGPSSHPTGGSAQIGWQLSPTDYAVWSTPVVPPANSAVRFYVPGPIAEFHMDEPIWSGAAGEVLDSAGHGYDATAANGAVTSSAAPAIAGTPGTCGYGVFDGSNDYVALPASFPNLATDFTLTAWIRTTNNAKSGQRIFIDDQNNTGGFGFSLGDGGAGRLRFYTRAVNPIILDTPNVIQNNTWYFVAAVADLGAKTKSLYVYNQAGAQLAYVTQTYTGTWGADTGAASIGGENNASTENGSSFRFSGNLDEVGVYKGAMNAAQLSQVMSQKRPCSIVTVIAPAGFNAFETGTPAGSASGVIHTKVSASAFNLAVVALKSGGAAVETAFTGNVKLELVDASVGASCGAFGLIRSLGTLTFAAGDAGRKTLAGIVEPNAWPNARIRMTYPATGAPTIVACSTDNFAIRPASFGNVTVSDADSVSAGATRTLANTAVSGGNVHKAGQPFQIVATAVNAAGAPTSNYSGNPAASLTACVLPATGCTLGTLATGTWSAAAGTGTVTTTGARYSEVGAFAAKLSDASFAAVDAADGSTTVERTIESAAFNVGRFVPDHFELAAVSMPVFKTFNDTTCATRSFTYAGQPFGYLTLPQATITAKNAAGAITINYAGALWKLVAAGAVQTYTSVTGNLDIGLLLAPTVAASGGGAGALVANTNDAIAFVRATPVAPFTADIGLSMAIQDIAESGVSGNGTVDTLTPALFSNIAFDAGNQIRFGQLVMSNALGSELLGLPVPIETRYWNGSGFALNTTDFCTQLSASNVSLTNWRRNLNACETSVSLSGRFNKGRGSLRLSAPGVNNTGSADLTVQLGAVASGSTCVAGVVTPAVAASQSWLQGHWSGTPVQYDQDPAARASFGLHRDSKPLIYLREMY
ncbi:MAG: LamG domain-containing protein [Rhizobium sp.]|nr:LamG domain-containing protein [Rhizobium sp.]